MLVNSLLQSQQPLGIGPTFCMLSQLALFLHPATLLLPEAKLPDHVNFSLPLRMQSMRPAPTE